MLKLKEIIIKLDGLNYDKFVDSLNKNKAEKYIQLLHLYREKKSDDSFVMGQMGISTGSLYTLKSRLYDKLQEFLSVDVSSSKLNLYKQIEAIPYLLFNTEKNAAIAILTKLEKELIEYDMPFELTNIYSALKKLHISSSKYYHYSQLYNKHVAYTMALDKAEDILLNFSKTLGIYYISGNTSLKEVLDLMQKEMDNISKLYESHRLKVYKTIIDLSSYLFIEKRENIHHIEKKLARMYEIMSEYRNDMFYDHFISICYYLGFMVAFKGGEHRKADDELTIIGSRIGKIQNFNTLCLTYPILLFKIQHAINIANKRKEPIEEVLGEFQYVIHDDRDDLNGFVICNVYNALLDFYGGRYKKTLQQLLRIQNEATLIDMPLFDLQIKLMICVCYALTNEQHKIESIVRSCKRIEKKLSKKFNQLSSFYKLLKQQRLANDLAVLKNLQKFYQEFNALNMIDNQPDLFPFFQLSEGHLNIISKQR